MRPSGLAAALTTAALALPGVAQAQITPPEKTSVGVKWLEYHDYRAKGDLMTIRAPVAWVEMPINEAWSVEASFLYDSISGATPVIGGASGGGTAATPPPAPPGTPPPGATPPPPPPRPPLIDTAKVPDQRYAGDAKATYYMDNSAVGVGMAVSKESDWQSVAGSVDWRWATASRNTTYNLGFGVTGDDISSVADANFHDDRQTFEFLAGVTQVLSPTQLVQVNAMVSSGFGGFSDPYRDGDVRPRERVAAALLVRYRHYVEATDGALHVDNRIFVDDWGIVADTIDVSFYQPLFESWMIRPGLRYYVQGAADFYSPGAAPAVASGHFANDPRLGAFGAIAPYIGVEKSFESGLTLGLRGEYYERQEDFNPFGGSEHLPGLKFWSIIASVSFSF